MDVKKFDISRLSGNRSFQPELVDYEDSIDIIADEIHSVRKSFVKIGWYLKHIKEKEMYRKDGYEDIFEFAHAKFKMSEGTVSRMINLCIEFSVGHDSPELDERYQEFSESQLFEMLPMKEDEREQVSPDMTVKEIREKKAENKAGKEPPQKLIESFLKERQDIDLSDYETVTDLKKFLADIYGKAYASGNHPCNFESTPRGIRLKYYDEITWLAFAKKAWILKESNYVGTLDVREENAEKEKSEDAQGIEIAESDVVSLLKEAMELSQNLCEGFRFGLQNRTLAKMEEYKKCCYQLYTTIINLNKIAHILHKNL